jgi:hypothetical protein
MVPTNASCSRKGWSIKARVCAGDMVPIMSPQGLLGGAELPAVVPSGSIVGIGHGFAEFAQTVARAHVTGDRLDVPPLR